MVMNYPHIELRSDQRHDVSIPCLCRTSTGYECGVTVSDLSASGCGLAGNWVGLSPGQRVSLSYADGLSATGVLRWSTHKTAGVQFDTRLSAQTVKRLMQAYPSPGKPR